MAIENFRGEHYFLSSMFEVPKGIELVEGLIVPTSEHPYQAAKFLEAAARTRVLQAPNGFAARSVSRTLEREGSPVREDWSDVKVPVMRAAVALKFGQNQDVAESLVATGEEEIVEVRGKDVFWGVHPKTREGLNWLGRILMEARDTLVDQTDQMGVHAERLLVMGSIPPQAYINSFLEGAGLEA